MIGGAALVAYLVYLQRGRRSVATAGPLVISGVITIAAIGMLVLGSVDDVSTELSETSLSKFLLLGDVMSMLKAHGVLGVGRGAFESTFPRFWNGTYYAVVTHPENLLAQWSTEWGIPVAVAGLVSLAVALRPRVALSRSSSAIGAWGALVTLFLHNLADFNSEVPGVMIAAATCAAIVTGGTAGEDHPWRMARWWRRPRLVAVSAGAATLFAVALAWGSVGHELSDDKMRAHASRPQPSSARHQKVRAFARTLMGRHPAEPYIPFAVALRAVQRRDMNPMPWLAATLERARVHGPAHFLIAQVIASRSPSQARLEYRVAIEQAGELFGASASAALGLVKSYDDALEVVPASSHGAQMLEALAMTSPQPSGDLVSIGRGARGSRSQPDWAGNAARA